MKTAHVIAAALAISVSMPLMAAPAPSVGTLTAASQGTVIVRNGKLIVARPGQALLAGDRVITRGKARAKVSRPGCTVALVPTSILQIGSTCTQPQSFYQAEAGAAAGAAAAGGGLSAVEIGLIAAAAAGGLGGGIAAATTGDPASP